MTHRLYTHSASKLFRACARAYKYGYVLGARALRTPWALAFGTIVHAALEAYWRARQAGRPDPGAAGLATLAALPDDTDPFERAKLRVLVAAYATTWDRVRCEVLAVEAQFEAPLVDPATGAASAYWRRAGKIDLVIRGPGRAGRPVVVLVEHKTSAEDLGLGGAYRRRLALDEQITFYLLGARALGFAPEGVIYDVLRKPDAKPLLATPVERQRRRKRDGALDARQRERDETPAEYEARLAAKVAEDPDGHIVRVPVHRFGGELARFERDVWDQSELIRFAEERDAFPQNSAACFAHHGACPYVDVCEGTARLDDPARFRRLPTVHPELAAPLREEA